MIGVAEAVDSTLTYLQQFEKVLPLANVRLEEFEYDSDDRNWLITLSFADPQASVLHAPSRTYRTFTIDSDTGDIRSMKLRNPLARP
jgi:hypothetical protein